MDPKIQRPWEFINDVRFRVFKERFSRKKLFPRFVAGTIILTIAVFGLHKFMNRDALLVEAELVSYSPQDEKNESGCSDFSFLTPEGKRIYLHGRCDGKKFVPKAKKIIKVIYEKDDPKKARLYHSVSLGGYWFFPLFWSGVVSIFWLGLVFIFWGFND